MLSKYNVYKNEAIMQFNRLSDKNSYCLFATGTKSELINHLAFRIVSLSESFSDISDRIYSDDEKLFIAAWIGELYEAKTTLFPVDLTDNECYVVTQKNGYRIKPIVEKSKDFIFRTRGEI